MFMQVIGFPTRLDSAPVNASLFLYYCKICSFININISVIIIVTITVTIVISLFIMKISEYAKLKKQI